MVLGPVFEIGSMTGLMSLFSRHSEIMTNFSIYMAESRPYWPQVGCGSPRCAEGPAGAWSAWEDTVGAGLLLVGPWQYHGGLLGSTSPLYPPGIPTPGTHLTHALQYRSVPPEQLFLDRPRRS